MAGGPVTEPNPSLEVHLPQQVWRLFLEALSSRASCPWGNDTAMAAKDLMNRRNSGTAHTIALQYPRNLASAPGWMGVAYCNNFGLDLSTRSQRRCMRPAGAIDERYFPNFPSM